MKLHPSLDAVLTELGATDTEKMTLLGFLANTLSSAVGQVDGYKNSAANYVRQQEEAQMSADAIAKMVSKFTIADGL
jgi:hypothetical protein